MMHASRRELESTRGRLLGPEDDKCYEKKKLTRKNVLRAIQSQITGFESPCFLDTTMLDSNDGRLGEARLDDQSEHTSSGPVD